MKIGVVAHVKYPISEPFAGGLEMHTHQLARMLRERGHEVVVFAATKSDPALNTEAICDQTELDALCCAEAPEITFFKEHHAYLRLMTNLRERDFDVIHNNSLHYLPVALADSLPMPMLTTLHTPPFCWLESGIRLCRADNAPFVAVSNAMRDMWAPTMPIAAVVMNGIDLGNFAYSPVPDMEPYLVWSGRIVPEKGLHHAIDAALTAGMALRIAGPISNPAYFANQIKQHLGPQISYVGHLAHHELAALFGGARAALCTPCWEEPYGLVVAEALACGVPVVGFARGALPELLTAECGVLVPPDDAKAMGHAVAAAMRLDRADCRARAELRCDAERMIDAYEALYRRAVGRDLM